MPWNHQPTTADDATAIQVIRAPRIVRSSGADLVELSPSSCAIPVIAGCAFPVTKQRSGREGAMRGGPPCDPVEWSWQFARAIIDGEAPSARARPASRRERRAD